RPRQAREARRGDQELQSRRFGAGGRREAAPSHHDSAGHSDRSRSRNREVHQGQEAEEGPGVDSRRSGAGDVALEGRVAGDDATTARTRLRRIPPLWKLQVASAANRHRSLRSVTTAPELAVLRLVPDAPAAFNGFLTDNCTARSAPRVLRTLRITRP